MIPKKTLDKVAMIVFNDRMRNCLFPTEKEGFLGGVMSMVFFDTNSGISAFIPYLAREFFSFLRARWHF